jgi:hypothetical protein
MVKQWELNQEFQLEGMGKAVHGPQAEARSWVWDNAFNTSPNLLHIPPGSPSLHNGTRETWEYLAFAWYHEQLILNYSDYHPEGRPIDWPYALSTLNQLSAVNSGPQASLMMLWLIKALQASQFDSGPEIGPRGWHPGINRESMLVDPSFPVWSEYSPSQRANVTEAYMQHWLAAVKQFTPLQFYKGGWASPTEIPVANFVDGWGNQLYYSLPQIHFYGASSGLVNQIADWAKTVWPLGNWDLVKSATCHNDVNRGGIVVCTNYIPGPGGLF